MRRQGAMRRQGMCRHNASTGGPGTSPMCRHNASSASARNVLPKLRVPCIYIYRCITPGGQVQPVVLRPHDSLSSASCELQAAPGHLCLTTSREQCPVAPIKRLKYSDFLAGYMSIGRLDMPD